MKRENISFLTARFCLCILLLSFAGILNRANAQYPTSKSAGIAGEAVVFIAAKFRLPGLVAGKYETRYATGFLVSDQKKIYLVTTKHAIQNTVLGQQSGLLCDSLFISASTAARLNSIKYNAEPDLRQNRGDYICSDDPVDLAILSLNSRRFIALLTSMRKNGRKPIPLSAFRTAQENKPIDTMYHAGYMVYQHPELGLAYVRTGAWSKWGVYDRKETKTSFLTQIRLPLASSGSPVITSEKLAGVIITGNEDEKVLDEPNFVNQGTVIKFSVLSVLLRKLQSMENKQISKPN